MSDITNMDPAKKVEPPREPPPCMKAIRALSPAHYGAIVTVEVGSEPAKHIFQVFKGLLAHYSTYFRAALQDCWREGEENTVQLSDDNPEVFSAVFHWLFTQKFYYDLSADGSIPLADQLICEIYVFGDSRGMPGLCNDAMDLLFQKCMQVYLFPRSCIYYVWEHTLEDAALRKFLIDFAVENYAWPTTKLKNEYPAEFLLDVITASRERAGVPGSICPGKAQWTSKKKAEFCGKYHTHSSLGK
ncbi:hypothetical protein BKA63DRAFT_600485 [Paraphoma chrysanthemicola]|nr:hypothetical protein BKA63DRAFT_600485 [Paraphoma chrysanthemicola]